MIKLLFQCKQDWNNKIIQKWKRRLDVDAEQCAYTRIETVASPAVNLCEAFLRTRRAHQYHHPQSVAACWIKARQLKRRVLDTEPISYLVYIYFYKRISLLLRIRYHSRSWQCGCVHEKSVSWKRKWFNTHSFLVFTLSEILFTWWARLFTVI